jgi:hypothetical protein
MKIHRFLNSFLLVSAAVIGLAASRAQAANVPVWTFFVPTSSLSSSTSDIASVTSDSAGNTLLVIEHDPFAFPGPGVQIFLLNSHGVALGGGDYPTIHNVSTLFVSAKKVLVSTSPGVLMQGAFDANGLLVFTPLPFQTGGETSVISPLASGFDRKYVHSTVATSNKVSEIRRYALTKLTP